MTFFESLQQRNVEYQPLSVQYYEVLWTHNIVTICIQIHNDTIFLGAFEANPTFVDIDPKLVYGLYDFEWDVYMPYLQKHMELMPKLSEVGQKTIICGPECFTADAQAIFGQDSNVSLIRI